MSNRTSEFVAWGGLLSESTELSKEKLFRNFADHMDALLLENQKSFDQAILTLSSALVGGLLAFTQAKPNHVLDNGLFYYATLPYAMAIIATLFSFLLAQTLVQQKRDNAERYYIKGDEDSFNKKFCLDPIIKGLHWFSALAFVFSTVMAITFVAQVLNY